MLRHNLAATSPGIVPKPADFSRVNRRIWGPARIRWTFCRVKRL